MASNFDDILDEILQELMELYGCDNPIEALSQYGKDDMEYEWQKIKAAGGTREDFEEYMEEELNRYEQDRMKDPEKAIVNNKLIILLEKYSKEDYE